MSENLQTPEQAAEAALAEYKAYGPETAPMQIEREKMERWIKACNGAELTAQQHCDLAWLKIEYAGAHPNKKAARQTFLEAEKDLKAAIKHPETDHYTKAKAFWAIGSLPVIQAMLRIAYEDTLTRQGKSPQLQKLRRLYNKSFDFAASETYMMVQSGDLAPHETAFCQTVAVAYHLTETPSKLFSVIPGLPRCYEDTDSSDAWHATVWDARGLAAQLKLGRQEDNPDYLVIEGLTQPGQAESEDNFALFNNVFRVLIGEAATPQQQEELAEANIRLENIAVAFFDRYAKGKEASTPEASTAKFALEGLTAAELPHWYANLVESRLFSYAEAIQLDKLAVPYLLGKLKPDTEQSLALQYLRLECALAMADSNPAAAKAQLTNFELTTPPLLREMTQEQNNITALYEASVHMAIAPFYGALLQEQLPPPEAFDQVGGELADLFSEMLWEKKQPERTKEERESLHALLLSTFNALFLTITSQGQHLYLPALTRQRTATINNWDINAWRARNGRYAPVELRKLRLVPSGRLRHEGDIACVPLGLMGQRDNPEELVAAFVESLSEEDASPRATALLKRRGTKTVNLLTAAWNTAVR